jgi:glycogen debranching enzyme
LTAILAWAERDHQVICRALGLQTASPQRETRAHACLDRLWSDELGRYRFFDAAAKRYDSPHVVSSYAGLLCNPSAERRTRLLDGIEELMQQPFPLPTCAPSDPDFDAHRYWRGPTWINIDWLFSHVPELTAALRASICRLVERAGFREYYDAQTGEGLGARDFTWSAALYLDVLCRTDQSPATREKPSR